MPSPMTEGIFLAHVRGPVMTGKEWSEDLTVYWG